MAKICSRCGKKIGFFEEDFNGLCKDCYNKKLDEENQLKLWKEKKKNEEKYESIKNRFLKFPQLPVIYSNIIKILNFPHGDILIYKPEYNSVDIVLKHIFKIIIKILPKDFTKQDIDEINNYESFLFVVNETNYMLTDTISTEILYDDTTETVDYQMKKIFSSNNSIYNFSQEIRKDLIQEDVILNDIENEKDLISKLQSQTSKTIDYCLSKGQSSSDMVDLYRKHFEEERVLGIKTFYNYVLSILYNIVFLENIEIFEQNVELNTMYNNLIQNTDDLNYVIEKLYYIYDKLYTNLFEEKMSRYEFGIFIIEKKFSNESNSYYKCNISVDKNMSIKEKISIIVEKTKEYYSENYENIIEEKNMQSDIYLQVIEKQIIKFIQSIQKEIDFDELLDISSKINTLAMEIDKWIDCLEAEREKERLLKGDMSKEIQKEELDLDYSLVKNGYEFEEYVANLYKKLGYTIEEVTKKSGDQGADVIAYKDNIKYVIQVKFYSSPVGNSAVQEVVASKCFYNANQAIVVTNNTFTKSAIELAQANKVELVDKDKLELMKKSIITSANNYFDKEEFKSTIRFIANNANVEIDIFDSYIMAYLLTIENDYNKLENPNNINTLVELIEEDIEFENPENVEIKSLVLINIHNFYIKNIILATDDIFTGNYYLSLSERAVLIYIIIYEKYIDIFDKETYSFKGLKETFKWWNEDIENDELLQLIKETKQLIYIDPRIRVCYEILVNTNFSEYIKNKDEENYADNNKENDDNNYYDDILDDNDYLDDDDDDDILDDDDYLDDSFLDDDDF